MLDSLKKKFYQYGVKLKVLNGIKSGKIIPFDDGFYSRLKHTYFSCLPVSIHIKYLKPIIIPGRCFDRSLYMFFCFENSLLVHGDNYYLELEYGKENAQHFWIEIGNYVYDPSLLMCIDKDLYYDMYKISNVKKYTKEEYCETDENKDLYYQVINTKAEDYMPGGNKRCTLLNMIPLVKEICRLSNNEEFRLELDEWLELIKYDEEEVKDEVNQKIFSIK